MDLWGETVLRQIEEVSIDLSGSYRGLVKKLMPQARIVADRFHVMQQVSQELNMTRYQEIKALAKDANDPERDRIKTVLKSSKYALLKPEASLTEKQRVTLERVKQISPKLAQMHQQKEDLRVIFETATDRNDGVNQMVGWLIAAQDTFINSTVTLTNWFDETVNYFVHRTSSGQVEGINNKLKLIKRSGYGFRNFANFELRCLICWHLDFSPAYFRR